MIYSLISLGGAAVLTVVFALLKNRIIKKTDLILKTLTLVLFAVFFVRYLGATNVMTSTIGLDIHSPFGIGASAQVKTVFSVLIMWATFAAQTLLVTYPFFKDKVPQLKGLVKGFATVVAVIELATVFLIAQAMDGNRALDGIFWRDVVYAVEVALFFSVCMLVYFLDVKSADKTMPFSARIKTALKNFGARFVTFFKTAFKSKAFYITVLAVMGMIVVSIPSYALQALFGYSKSIEMVKELTITHRIALYIGFILPIAIFLIFRGQDYAMRRYALLYISLTSLCSYCYGYTFANFIQPLSWPLHLCNTAMFIVPVCLIFKLDRVYYFTLFINVLGALLAMLMPNYGDTANMFSSSVINFWVNHFCAFFMPILMIALKIYNRPKIRQFIYSLVAFAVYFGLILVINAWFENYGNVDFFFLNSDFIAEKLGKWAQDLRNVVWTIKIKDLKFVFYPVYQLLFFLVYVIMSFAMWFIYEQFFQVSDLYTEMGKRNKKIKADRLALEVYMNGRSVTEPMNTDAINKLILKDFSKKYASSDIYAVDKANLEIDGGEIFGFLGPNGAGKSTIIKSIVGIQTITSGSIGVCGYDVEKQSVGAKMNTGFVPDHYALYENLTGREYVNYIADLYGVSKEDRTKRVDEYVERFYLQKSFDNQIKTYSHGMKQKITIMSALVHDPKLWILDEPLTGLDPESIFQVKECMKNHAAKGNIVFFSSHIIDVVERICDRIAIIKSGRILCVKTVKEIEDSGVALEDFYLDMIGEKRHTAENADGESGGSADGSFSGTSDNKIKSAKKSAAAEVTSK